MAWRSRASIIYLRSCRASTPAICCRVTTPWLWWPCSASAPWRRLVVAGGWRASRRVKEFAMYKLLGAAVALSLAGLTWADESTDKLDNPKPLPGDVSLPLRSEEHTSELQSLMRISYAV